MNIPFRCQLDSKCIFWGGALKKFEGGFVKSGDALYALPDYQVDIYLAGRSLPKKSIELCKKEAQQGIEEIDKWHEGISKNRIFNPQTPRLIRMEFKSIEIDDYYFDILGFKTDQRSESKKFDSKNATKLSQYSLISFQSFVYFYLRVRTNTGSYLVRVFVHNSFMRYHMNERTNRIDEITFPTYSTEGVFAIKNNFYFLSPNVTNKPADKYQFYSDGKAGFLTGEVIRDFTYDTFGRLYHDHS